MTIPDKYQVFDSPVTLSDKDQQRLSGYLTGWNRLIEKLMADVNRYDLQRLVVMELMGKQRRPIVAKLLVRLGKIEREKIELRISKCWKNK